MKTKDIAQSFKQLKFILDLEKVLENQTSIFAIALKEAIRKEEPVSEILEMIKMQAEDNPKMIHTIIGEKLFNQLT